MKLTKNMKNGEIFDIATNLLEAFPQLDEGEQGKTYPIKVLFYLRKNMKNLTTLAHKDYVNEDSLLYKILDRKEIIVNSLHHNTITEVGSSFKVVAHSEDNLIEAIEYNGNDRFVLGVQFHPEVLPQYNNIFKAFISRCKDDISM